MHHRKIFILFFFLHLFLFGNSENYADSILKLIPNAHDTVKISMYNELYLHYQEKDSKIGLEYLYKGLEIAKKNKDKRSIGGILNSIGLVFERRGSFEKASELFKEALQHFTELNDKKNIASTNANLGATCVDMGKFAQAMEYSLKALEFYKSIDNENNLALTYNNIGLIHYYQQDYTKAIELYYQALQIRLKIDDKDGIALAYNNIGICYYFLEEYDKVLESFFASLKIYEELNDLRGQVMPLFNIGEIYLDQGRFEDALEYYSKSLNIDKQLGDTSSIAETYSSIGNVYIKMNAVNKALKYQKYALELMKTTDYIIGLRDTYLDLSNTYEKLGDFKQALSNYKNYKSLQDSIYNEDKSKALAEVETKYKLEKNEEKIRLLNKEKLVNELELNQKHEKIIRQRIQMFFIGFGLLVLLVFFIIYFRLFKINKHKTNLLSERNHEINQQKEELQTALSLINDQKEELLQVNEEIVETTRAKEVFLANTTHEIRTPVNIISGFANLLSNTKIDKIQSRYLKNINNSAHNLLVVINDILTFSKIEADKLSIETIDFNIREEINNYFESIGITADVKNINLIFTIDKNIPEILYGDPVRLQQIISNLVGNAIKFTDKGGKIETNIKLEQEDQNQVQLTFSVKDNGIGIESDKLERIFESFTQADKTTSRKYGGTGLGLSIVKKLIDLQKGSIKVKSIFNEGSTFTFTLPYLKNPIHESSKKSRIEKIELSKTKNIKILIADDNPVNIELISDILNNYDSTILIDKVDNGQSAINKLKINSYNILLLDLQMPIMDGFKTANYIRNKLEEPTKNIPIIALSAFADDAQMNKCIEAGMNEFLAKPFEPNQLFNKINKLLGVENKIDNKSILISEIITNQKFEHIDLSLLSKMYKNNKSKIEHILNICLLDIPVQIQNMVISVENKNYNKLKIAAHSIKTTLNYLGLDRLTEAARQIEKNIIDEKNLNELPLKINIIKSGWNVAEKEIKNILNSKNN